MTKPVKQKSSDLISNIQEKRAKLEQLRTHLKNTFFGIDIEIDKIVDSMTTWYAMPEMITHPIIINLWSLTGNGKTDLVRTIVDFLDFKHNFAEIQLSDTPESNESTKIDKISTLICKSGCREDRPGIILLDEFQRFRTIDGSGSDIKNLPFQDIWMLLSDGRFPVEGEKRKNYSKLVDRLGREWICKTIEPITESRNNLLSEKLEWTFMPIPEDRKFQGWTDQSLIENVHMFLDCQYSIEDISSWTYLETLNTIKEYYKHRTPTYNFTKCLIFVAGNLDEAFRGASAVDDCDTDADTHHEFTKKISIIEIKQALIRRFKPEQVSRLGNNHVIYPALNKDSYLKIIKKSCLGYLKNAESISNVKFILDDSAIHEIYNNSVYPTQGTRPVFSSVHMMFTEPLTRGILWALENNIDSVTLKMESEHSCLTFYNNANLDQQLQVPIQFQIRDRKNRYTKHFEALVSVHECGHAIIHASLFHAAPQEIKINVASFDGGYNIYDSMTMCAKDVLNRICVLYGGIVAEKLVFGDDNISTGSASDIKHATELAAYYVRKWAMSPGQYGLIDHLPDSNNSTIRKIEATDGIISDILNDQYKRAKAILEKHKTHLVNFSIELLSRKAIDQKQFKVYFKDTFDFSDEPNDYRKTSTNTKYYDILIYNQ